MVEQVEPKWLQWARRLQSLAQAGLAFSKDEYDLDRFKRVLSLSAEIMAEGSGEPLERVEALFATETGYLTPKIDVRGAVFQDDRILMVRENVDAGKWTLPGGWGDVNNTPSENVEREVREETGLHVKARKLAAVYDRTKQGHALSPHHSYKLFFICDVIGGNLQTSFETGEGRFFNEHELPSEENLSLGRIRLSQIHRMFKHMRHPELATDFD
jgi:ADP-ribose pyrophosphatase YjhB (NUDIX family)